ncbi:regulator of G-protein signaling protein-like isoform X2 [Engraulis encrasicolus]|uniref:regulator of G-protein signaling protein-like isoform X2 n=1 Tax=Engraulis encrasicolus TaxID=184585 RepID=UPI002FD0E5B2
MRGNTLSEGSNSYFFKEDDERALPELLKDDIFVDFFNTFLNLPVFGQTPLYLLQDNTWILFPELHQSQVNEPGFLQWLATERLPLFRQTELYHHYLLCTEILELPCSQTKGERSWSRGDQWLLKRCIGSVRGMLHYGSYIAGTRGEELLRFSVRVSRLLCLSQSLDRQQASGSGGGRERQPWSSARYRALLSAIQINHLSQGSDVMAVCQISPAEAAAVLAEEHSEKGRQELLWRMRAQAVLRLKHYWAPHFLGHSKALLGSVPECRPLMEEYQRLASSPCDDGPQEQSPGLPGLEGSRLERNIIRRSADTPSPYHSKNSKKLLWRSQVSSKRPKTPGTSALGPRQQNEAAEAAAAAAPGRVCQWLPMEGEPWPDRCTSIAHNENSWLIQQHSGCATVSPPRVAQASKDQVLPDVDVPHACMGTPVLNVTVELEVPKPPADAQRFAHVGPALRADELAGGPYAAFLEVGGLDVPRHHLALWRELDGLLSMLLQAQGDDSLYAQKQAAARRIADAFLSGGEAERRLALDAGTCARLRELLPSGKAIPWIYAAQYDICKVLSSSYDSYLDEEDRHFCLHLFGTKEPVCGKRKPTSPPGGLSAAEQQLRRMSEALALARASCGHADSVPLSRETWALLLLEDVSRYGSIHLHCKKTDIISDMPFEKLAVMFPKLAAEKISTDFHIYCKENPPTAKPKSRNSFSMSAQRKDPKKDTSFCITPTMKPRTYADMWRTPPHLDSFKRFLRYHGGQGALLFIQDVERLRSIDTAQNPKNIKQKRRKIHNIVESYFRREDAREYLQCNADIISNVSNMRPVNCEILYTIQDVVNKSLEATWFKQYMDMFPACPTVVPDTVVRENIIKDKLKNVWTILSRFIKGVCKFKAGMANHALRAEFESFLRHNYLAYSDSYGLSPMSSSQDMSGSSGSYKDSKEDEGASLRQRLINGKPIFTDFLVNDFSFYQECERFRSLADSGTAMATAGLYGENDYNMLYQKADMIIRLFLKSEFSPKLRVNIPEAQRDAILQLFQSGRIDRTLFYVPIVTIFPILIICWKKFCTFRVMKSMLESKRQETTKQDIKEDNKAAARGDKVTKVKMKEQPTVTVTAPPDFREANSNWYQQAKTIISLTDEHTIVRFSTQRGIRLIVPQGKADIKACHNSDSMSAFSGRGLPPLFGASDSLGRESPLQKEPSNTHFIHPEGSLSSGASLTAISEEA